jgi:hypothetical protein
LHVVLDPGYTHAPVPDTHAVAAHSEDPEIMQKSVQQKPPRQSPWFLHWLELVQAWPHCAIPHTHVLVFPDWSWQL